MPKPRRATSPRPSPRPSTRGLAVELRAPTARDRDEFLERARKSRELHRPYVYPPADAREFGEYLARSRAESQRAYLICERETGSIAGVCNLNEIVLQSFRSSYLGYYAFDGFAGRGFMRQGLTLVLRAAFGEIGLHRVEANIQPGNRASVALAHRLGFELEGISRRYLKIGGRWRDHERWALLVEDWRANRGERARGA